MTPSTGFWLGSVALGMSLLATVLALLAHRRQTLAERTRYGGIAEALRSGDAPEALRLAADGIAELGSANESTRMELARLAERQRESLTHVGVVRFDALQEHTGELSFSLALLDDTRTGVVVTSIAGRQQTRVYAKSISEGRPSVVLSDEEETALGQALEPR